VIGFGYWLQEYSGSGRSLSPASIAEIVLFAMFVGAAAGASSQLGMSIGRHLSEMKRWPPLVSYEIVGGAIGCAMGVTLLGMLGGLVFGGRTENPVNLPLLAAVCLIGMCVAIVLYDTGGRWKRMTVYAVVPGFITVPYVFLAFVLLDIDLSAADDVIEWLVDGTRVGAILGSAMGLQIGIATFWYHRAGSASGPGR
jgi:hypothetical protein